eukprot:TRINITY_DN6784_c0_g1_i1.p1 TRINITY_DN6784_c0_g1~~TRINITY_DN6784_c0_g1_i1.p1  ORF type:complete len:1090 (+),score=260.02 TRINITY_DN6784_c0_g1_i1:142-3270(+)
MGTRAPGGRIGAMWWTQDDHTYLFGGNSRLGYFNDLWLLNSTESWTLLVNNEGVNQSTTDSNPGARSEGATWANSHYLYLFGGEGWDVTGNFGLLNDLWAYDLVGKRWIHLNNDTIRSNTLGSYGTYNTGSAQNRPGARKSAAFWMDSIGLYLFGGYGFDAVAGPNYLSDLWMFDAQSSQWAWIGGNSSVATLGFYGDMGTSSYRMWPGSRSNSFHITGSDGHFYLVGGIGFTNTSSPGFLNDVWSYDSSHTIWKWHSGAISINSLGHYGKLNEPNCTNLPPSRSDAMGWSLDQGFVMYGGYASNNNVYGDVWIFNITLDTWIWISGSNLKVEFQLENPISRANGIYFDDFLFGGDNQGALSDLWEFNLNSQWEFGNTPCGPTKALSEWEVCLQSCSWNRTDCCDCCGNSGNCHGNQVEYRTCCSWDQQFCGCLSDRAFCAGRIYNDDFDMDNPFGTCFPESYGTCQYQASINSWIVCPTNTIACFGNNGISTCCDSSTACDVTTGTCSGVVSDSQLENSTSTSTSTSDYVPCHPYGNFIFHTCCTMEQSFCGCLSSRAFCSGSAWNNSFAIESSFGTCFPADFGSCSYDPSSNFWIVCPTNYTGCVGERVPGGSTCCSPGYSCNYTAGACQLDSEFPETSETFETSETSETVENPGNQISQHSSGSGVILGTSLGVSLGVLCLAIPLVAFLIIRNFNLKKKENSTSNLKDPLSPTSESLRDISVFNLKPIGRGNFGEVYLGMWGKTEVALKTLTDVDQKIWRETKILRNLNHPNVIRYYGVLIQEKANYIVMEYASNGTLLDYVQNTQAIPVVDLLIWAHNTACGMVYLASKHIVHKDLSLRNLLLNKEGNVLRVKIADFGLADFTKEYFRQTDAELGPSLPIRWCAPESVLQNKFSTASDIWSFGIVLWELFSHGTRPYAGDSNKEVIRRITEGHVMDPPLNCPSAIASLMKSCWQMDSNLRPSFETAQSRIEQEMLLYSSEIVSQVEDVANVTESTEDQDSSDSMEISAPYFPPQTNYLHPPNLTTREEPRYQLPNRDQ